MALFHYLAYGLAIHSDMLLPELASTGKGASVWVRLVGRERIPPGVTDEPFYVSVTPEEGVVSFRTAGVFLLHAGREVEVIPSADGNERSLQLFLETTVMGLLAYQRGMVVLHASAVRIGEVAVAFVGSPGAGKTTMAAALYAQGHPLICEEVAAIDTSGQSPVLMPGSPVLRTNPEVAATLGFPSADLYQLHPMEEKLGFRCQRAFADQPTPLKCVYTLVGDTALAIEPLRPQDMAMELVANSYVVLHQPNSAYFLQCVQIARRAPVYRLARPRALDMLPEVVRMVEEHVRSQG